MDGTRVPQTLRREDVSLLRGVALFTGDLTGERCLEAHFIRSPEAHGVLARVDVSRARGLPGGIAVYAGGDLPELLLVPSPPDADFPDEMERPALAKDRVRYVGEPLAVVLADNRYLAEDAAELVSVEIDPLTPVMNAGAARQADAPRLFPSFDNVVWRRQYGAPVDDVFASAPVVVEGDFEYPRVAPSSIEGRAIFVRPEARGGLTVWCSHQAPHRLQGALASALDIGLESVRVIVPAVGGAFGGKSQTYPEYVVLAWLALRLGRPVRWIEDRAEALTAASHGRGQLHRARLAASEDGKLLALEASIDAEAGAYPHTGSKMPLFTAWVMSGSYRIPRLHVTARSVLTNAVPITAYRGAGRPEAAFTLEGLMDRLAAATGLDPVEVRMRNLLTLGDYPYSSPTGALYDSGNPAGALRLATEVAGYAGWRSEQARRRGTRGETSIGIGIGCYVERAGGSVGSTEFGSVEVRGDGRIEVAVGSSSTGQGHETAFAELVASVLEVDPRGIEVVQGDTKLVPRGTGSFASRSMQIGGAAVIQAAGKLLDEARRRATSQLEVDEDDVLYARGKFSVAGAQKVGVTLEGLALDDPLKADAEPGPPQSFPYGAYVAVVEVDRATGFVEVLKLVAVEDCGVLIHPTLVHGQVMGSAVQGLGQVLMEIVTYSDAGQPLAGTLADYLLPLSTDIPHIEVRHTEVPNPNVPHGAKGAGEGGCIGAPPAIANAVLDAIAGGNPSAPLRLPLSPEVLFATPRTF